MHESLPSTLLVNQTAPDELSRGEGAGGAVGGVGAGLAVGRAGRDKTGADIDAVTPPTATAPALPTTFAASVATVAGAVTCQFTITEPAAIESTTTSSAAKASPRPADIAVLNSAVKSASTIVAKSTSNVAVAEISTTSSVALAAAMAVATVLRAVVSSASVSDATTTAWATGSLFATPGDGAQY